MAKSCKQGGYAFGAFRLDRDKRMLYRDEMEVSLPPKVVETLIVLVENQGEIVSKADLMEKVWADSVVEESNLSQHLYLLRKTLGDAANGRPVIETLRRRGYRFNAEATVISPDAVTTREPAARPPGGHVAVRRQGNVLTVADWEPVPEPEALSAADAPEPVVHVNPKPRHSILKYAVAVGIAAAALLSTYFFWPTQKAANLTADGEIVTSFLTNGRPLEALTLSLDGDYFVYHENEESSSRLWLQQTGQPGRIEIGLPGELWIGAKTFSPDGQFIYFSGRAAAEQKDRLYRVPTLGGLHTKVLDDVSTPVTFSPDGTQLAFIRYEGERSSALVVASADGRNERTLLKREVEQSFGLGSSWSPDGKLIAFSTIEMDESGIGHVSLVAFDLTNGKTVSLSPEQWDTCYRMQWTQDGRGLVFIGTRHGESNGTRRDQVYYLSFPQGQARRLTNEGNRHDVVSLGVTKNDEIAVLPRGRSSQIWIMDASGDSRTALQITRGLLDGRAGIAPLPDGRVGYIARTGENVNVWIMNADGSNSRQLTSEPAFAEELRASPDGTYFVFSSPVGRNSHLFTVRPDGAGPIQVTGGNSSAVDSSISHDGAWIAYSAAVFEGVYGKSYIWKVPSNGGEPSQISRQECASPHFSPDGMTISCIKDEGSIVILNASDGEVLRTIKPRSASRLNFGARWSPAGDSVVYVALDKGTANLWTQPIAGGEPRRLTDFAGGDIYNFAFSSDGKKIFLARGHPIQDAMLIRSFR